MAHIACFGGLILDWVAHTQQSTFPVQGVSYNFSSQIGGVAFNLTRNLKQLGYDLSLFTAINHESTEIIDELTQQYSIHFTFTLKDQYPSARIVLVSGLDGICLWASTETKIFDAITIEDLIPHISNFFHSKVWVLDTDLPTSVATWIAKELPQKTYLFTVVVDTPKVHQLPADLTRFSGIFLNHHELGELTNQMVKSGSDAIRASKTLLNRGAQNVFVTIEENGAVALSQTEQYYLSAEPTGVPIYKTIGAGDALASGVIHAIVEQHPLKECLYQGVINAKKHLLCINS